MSKYIIKFKLKLPHDYKVPDIFNTVGEAERFIRNWNLDKYNPEIINISEEQYTKWLAARIDLGAHEAHLEHLRDFSRQVDKQRYDLTDDGTGKKYDTGKSMVGTLSRIFSRALLGVGTCITFGTTKYPSPDNWRKVEGAFERYQDSMMRHYLKFLSGEERDSETNILHLCHMTWNALAITELYLMQHPEYNKELFK